MVRSFLCGLVVTAIAGSTHALAGPLHLCHARIDGNGVLHVREIVAGVPIEQKILVKRQKGGEYFDVEMMIQRTHVSEQIVRIAAQAVKVFDSDNNPVDAARLPELFQREVPIVLSDNDKKIEAPFLKVLKKGTLIVVVPMPWQTNAPYGGYGAIHPPQALPLPPPPLPAAPAQKTLPAPG